MKIQTRSFVARKPETIDITAFFKKFCIATRTNIPCVQRGRVGLRHKLGTSDYPHLSMMCPSDIKSEYMHPWLNGRAAAL